MSSQEGRYDHKTIEEKWRNVWLKEKLDQADISGAQKPFYNLMMFPYPSAEGLHVGNMYAFTGSDIYGRYKRMQGYDVFEPIGLDGFGIHSENYALKIGRHPMEHAKITQKNFYNQLHKIGAMFDWSQTVETYDPDYYRWTQWIFVQMFKHGLAYRGKASVNWCPSDKTVLADEQVIDGKCERCGNIVEKRLLDQWFFRITAYAEKLLENLPKLDWSEKVKVAQKNWIGKKEGINITYSVVDESGKEIDMITCFTTRPDTNFGATFVVVAPEHPFVAKMSTSASSVLKKKLRQVAAYLKKTASMSQEDRVAVGRKKTGVFTGLYCINQLTKYKMPLYVSDFVVMGFGTGAVVGVPGHDRRDFEFAKAFDLPIVRVVVGKDGDTSPITKIEQVQEEEGTMTNSGFLDGLDIHEATNKMMDYLEEKGWGKRVTTYHLRDWLISRQRYWGPPIPMIFCKHCEKEGKSWFTIPEAAEVGQSVIPSEHKRVEESLANASFSNKLRDPSLITRDDSWSAGWYPVPEHQLPVKLPYIEDYKPGNDGIAPLAKHKEFYETICPGCGAKAVRETDVSDTFLDSSWYFLRYTSTDDKTCAWNPERVRHWLPVSMYTGGVEHSVLHLLYSRFVTMAFHDWGLISHFEEPFTRFFAHGLVIKDGAKMSKSKGNVINPDEYIETYSCDALRLYLMFMGPFSDGGDFRDTAMEGMSRWVRRIWRLSLASLSNVSHLNDLEIKRALHKLVKKVTEDIERRHYNTAIAAMMEFTNLVDDKGGALGKEELGTFLKLLAPFAPYLAEELWQKIRAEVANENLDVSSVSLAKNRQRLTGSQRRSQSEVPQNFFGSPHVPFTSIHLQPWPTYDTGELEEETVGLLVQVNGRLRDKIIVDTKQSKDQSVIEELVRKSEKVSKFLDGKSLKKIIFVPGRLINFVV